ncbi:hypothetical protein [Staphylococcus phage vB_StaM_PB50]|nr:hypothetical protein [Staphylococcus phage vB_StaM_PB50]
MAITRRKVTNETKDLSVLESAELKVSEEQGYKGDVLTFEIETIPEKYDRKNLVLIPEDDNVIKINYNKNEINIASDELKDVIIKLKDIPTDTEYDNVTITASGINPDKEKEIKEEKVEEVKNPVKKKSSTKTKTSKKDDNKVEKIKVNRVKKDVKKTTKKKYSDKSYTKDELLNDLLMNLVDESGNEAYSKKELKDIVTLADSLRTSALKEGKTISINNINFTRKLQKARIHAPKLDTVKSPSYVTPHIVMQAKVESDDKEVLKGEKLSADKFRTKDGEEIDLNKVNEEYEKEFKNKFQ